MRVNTNPDFCDIFSFLTLTSISSDHVCLLFKPQKFELNCEKLFGALIFVSIGEKKSFLVSLSASIILEYRLLGVY